MTRLLAVTAAVFAFAGAASATVDQLPPSYVGEADSLAVRCGGERAVLIARMDFARDIHVQYVADVAAHPSVAKWAGDAAWHRWWAQTYVQVDRMLRQGCSR